MAYKKGENLPICVLILSLFCVLNFRLSSCKPHLVEVARTTEKVERVWPFDSVDYALKCLEIFNEKIDIYECNRPTSRSIFCHLDGFICQISGLKLFTIIIIIITIIVFLIVEVTGATALSGPWPLLGFSAIRLCS